VQINISRISQFTGQFVIGYVYGLAYKLVLLADFLKFQWFTSVSLSKLWD